METHTRIAQVGILIAVAVLLIGVVATMSATAEPVPLVLSVGPGQSAAALSGDAERGEDLWFEYYCYSCHGTAANGGAGPRISNTPRTMEGFVTYVRNPSRMPPYVNRVIGDQQLADIYEYLQSLPASPNVDNIPLLKELQESQ